MQLWLFGLLLELCATVLGTVGKQLVSYSARLPQGPRAKRLKVIGLTVTTLLGPLLDASAYAFAPQSVVAPMNGLDVVWNTMSAPFTLGEKLEVGHVIGALLVATGAGMTALLGPHTEESLDSKVLESFFCNWQFLFYVAAFVLGLVACAKVLRVRPRGCGAKSRAVALGATAGAIAGNMFFTTCTLRILRATITEGDSSLWSTPWPYFMIPGAVTVAVSNIPLMSRGLQEFEALFMVTLFEGCHIAVACISAQVVLREMQKMTWCQEMLYVLGLILIFLGLYAIQRTSVGIITRNETLRVETVVIAEDLRSEGSATDVSTLADMAVSLAISNVQCEVTRTSSWAEAYMGGLWQATVDPKESRTKSWATCETSSGPASNSSDQSSARLPRAASEPSFGAQ